MEIETIADILAEMRIFKCRNLATGELELCNAIANYFADRIEAAWKRERDELVYSFDPTKALRSRAPDPSAYAIEGMKGFENQERSTEMNEEKQETIADIVSELRTFGDRRLNETLLIKAECVGLIVHIFANRLEAAEMREKRLLKACARWILTHDIYGNMAKELLAECKEVLHDDGQFLMTEEGAENGKV